MYCILSHDQCHNEWRKGMLAIAWFPTPSDTQTHGSWHKIKNPYQLRNHIIPNVGTIKAPGTSWPVASWLLVPTEVLLGIVAFSISMGSCYGNPQLLKGHNSTQQPLGTRNHQAAGRQFLNRPMVASGIMWICNEYVFLLVSHDPWEWVSLGVGKPCNSQHPLPSLISTPVLGYGYIITCWNFYQSGPLLDSR